LPLWLLPDFGFADQSIRLYVAQVMAISVVLTWLYNASGGRLLLTGIAQAAVTDGQFLRSQRGFLAASAFLLVVPIAMANQIVFGVEAEIRLHFVVALGFALLALAVFDFATPKWITWMGLPGGEHAVRHLPVAGCQ